MDTDSWAIYQASLPPKIRLSRERELWAIGSAEARREIVEGYLRLVVWVARKYVGRGLELEELVCVGNEALIKAVERFDSKHGVRLVTYAVMVIRSHLLRALQQVCIVPLPARMAERVADIGRAERRLAQELDRMPTMAELAAEVGIKETNLLCIQRARRATIDLTGQTEDGVECDVGGDYDMAGEVEVRVRAGEAMQHIERLSDRTRYILWGHYVEGRTFHELGETLHLTGSAVHRIEREALRRLRAALVYDDMIGPLPDDDDRAALRTEESKETQESCPKCPLYRAGSKPYCAKTGARIKPDEALPLICRQALKIKPI